MSLDIKESHVVVLQLVESMLSKVMQEFERRIANQNEMVGFIFSLLFK